MKPIILAINPGSSSTKIALYRNIEPLAETNIRHDHATVAQFPSIMAQKDFRLDLIIKFVVDNGYSLDEIDIFLGRGGLLRPLASGGAYIINERMIADLQSGQYGNHASNLGAVLAYELAAPRGKPAYIVDPVIIDEMDDIARVSGHALIPRRSVFHALNQKAMAIRYAEEVNQPYRNLNLIVVHLGGGISIGLHRQGRVVDVNDALGGEGPFSPERSGSLPVFPLIDLCYSGRYTKEELKKLLVGKGGLASYLGTSDGFTISRRLEDGDKEAAFYLEAMAYQIVKEIGALTYAASGMIDAVIITGGFAHSRHLTSFIRKYLPEHVNLRIYPGEDEISALVKGGLRVYNGEEEAHEY